MAQPTIFIAVLAGLLSFLSPCILPIIPGFMAYLAGEDANGKISRTKIFYNSLAFVLGFSTIFALLGVLLNTLLVGISYAVTVWLGRIGGTIIIIFALHLLGLINIPFLQVDHKISVNKFSSSYITSYIFGASFAVGWTPCVGAILGSIFVLAATHPSSAFILLLFYAIGLGIPFLIIGIFTDQAVRVIHRSENFLKYFNIAVGVLLLILGVLVFTNNLILVSNLFIPASILK